MARSRHNRLRRVSLVLFIAGAALVALDLHRLRERNAKAAESAMTTLNSPTAGSPAITAAPTTKPTEVAAVPGHAGMMMAVATPAVIAAPPAVTSTANPLLESKNADAAGDLLTARKVLNDALIAGTLSPTDAAAAKKQIAAYNQTIVFSARKFPDDPFGGTVTVEPGQRLSGIASSYGIPYQLLQQLNNLSDPKKLRSGQKLKILKGPLSLIVSKGAFNMDIFIGPPGGPGSMYLTSFPVGLGKSDSTPTGTWIIANKVKHPTYYSPRGEGVIASDDPKNPLGPCWLGLEGTNGKAVGAASYGIHGTIEPDSIGKMASMGCIRMHNEDVQVVFALLVEGKSTVLVKD